MKYKLLGRLLLAGVFFSSNVCANSVSKDITLTADFTGYIPPPLSVTLFSNPNQSLTYNKKSHAFSLGVYDVLVTTPESSITGFQIKVSSYISKCFNSTAMIDADISMGVDGEVLPLDGTEVKLGYTDNSGGQFSRRSQIKMKIDEDLSSYEDIGISCSGSATLIFSNYL